MTFSPWTAGQRITAQRLNDMVGDWTSYTAAWTAATTNPGLGNGTLNTRYQLVGKTCHLNIHLIFGSTTTLGSGAYSIGIPFTSSGAMGFQEIGGQGFTGGGRSLLSGLIGSSSTALTIWGHGNTATSVIASVGNSGLFGTAWAAGDTVRLTGFYEIA